jgi:hypothetical protein
VSDLLLSHADLVELTGFKVAKCQAAELKRRGWLFEVNAAGAPLVARAYFQRRMVGEATVADPPPRAQHNWPALGHLRAVK